MKRFLFQFASVLKLRKLREDEALRALGATQRALSAALEEKAALLSKLNESLVRREALGARGGSVTPEDFRVEQDFIDGQKSRLARQEQIIIRSQRSVEKAFRTYLSARRQTQMLEKLRERHLEKFKQDRAKKEQRELDDLTVMRARMVAEERAEAEELAEEATGVAK
ncbi:MAG: flagellar export protein FliJ [Oligoflexia bacterium]|nr:flagellar export protein FliJ [Oligoflexia bacterium]